MDNIIRTFLRESNAIEGVYDEESLVQAEKAWEYLIAQDVLTVPVILETHRLLMINSRLNKSEIGKFRQCQVMIGGRFGLDYKLVPSHVLAWAFDTMREEPRVSPTMLHVEYEKIHPFVDGNGRTGRMFMNWTRIKRNNDPPLIIYEKDRQEYYRLFNSAIQSLKFALYAMIDTIATTWIALRGNFY